MRGASSWFLIFPTTPLRYGRCFVDRRYSLASAYQLPSVSISARAENGLESGFVAIVTRVHPLMPTEELAYMRSIAFHMSQNNNQGAQENPRISRSVLMLIHRKRKQRMRMLTGLVKRQWYMRRGCRGHSFRVDRTSRR